MENTPGLMSDKCILRGLQLKKNKLILGGSMYCLVKKHNRFSDICTNGYLYLVVANIAKSNKPY